MSFHGDYYLNTVSFSLAFAVQLANQSVLFETLLTFSNKNHVMMMLSSGIVSEKKIKSSFWLLKIVKIQAQANNSMGFICCSASRVFVYFFFCCLDVIFALKDTVSKTLSAYNISFQCLRQKKVEAQLSFISSPICRNFWARSCWVIKHPLPHLTVALTNLAADRNKKKPQINVPCICKRKCSPLAKYGGGVSSKTLIYYNTISLFIFELLISAQSKPTFVSLVPCF